jgi:hypothetical protein
VSETEARKSFAEWCKPDPMWEYEPGYWRCWLRKEGKG